MKKTLCIGSIVFIMCVSLGGWGATWYVDGSVGASGDGTTWETAKKTIQEGIEAASPGDTVIVAQGTYAENIRFTGKNIILCGTDPLDPAVVGSTVIDGNHAGSTVTFDGTEDRACVLSGFTIRNGSATYGGGICGGTFVNHARAVIENNIITTNSAVFGGGLIFCEGTIHGNTISSNEAGFGGGGIAYCHGTIQGNEISWNSTTGNGGAGLYASNGIVQNNLIVQNSCRGPWDQGGGLQFCHGLIRNNVIARNFATYRGGGLAFCWGTTTNCIIWGNTAGVSDYQVSVSGQPSCCCIQDWTEGGTGNISDNPRLTADYHLEQDSPCIDAGCNQDWMRHAVDLDGNPRVAGYKVDMGAYEYQTPTDTSPPCVSGQDPAADSRHVPIGTNIVLHLKDHGDGVDETSIVMTVNGSAVTPGITGTPGDYTVSYDPPSDFPYSEIVTVAVDAADLSTPANVMERVTYSFTTMREPSAARTWYVDGSLSVSGDGTSPETAFRMIQEGIDVAEDGDTVIVAQGTYVENIRFESRNITLRSANPSDPTVVENTIIDGDQSGPVVTFSGTEDETCLISGFTIQGGEADYGGGICGGTAADHTRAAIVNNVITSNHGRVGAGGLSFCNGRIERNRITVNTTNGEGGAFSYCSAIIQSNEITSNSASHGGALSSCGGTIRGNLIIENSSGFFGGGLLDCMGTIEGNEIIGNRANDTIGGAIWCHGVIRNNLICHNTGPGPGGGLAASYGLIENNTISNNTVAGLWLCYGTIRNNILWGNGQQLNTSDTPTYSCIQDWTGGGEGNIALDPQLADSAGGDYHLV